MDVIIVFSMYTWLYITGVSDLEYCVDGSISSSSSCQREEELENRREIFQELANRRHKYQALANRREQYQEQANMNNK